MQPRQNPPGKGRTANVPQDPQGDEDINYDEAIEQAEEEEDDADYDEDEDLELEGEEDERDDDIPLSENAGNPDEAANQDETKDITV